jgi:sialic acid synthase SpsE
MMKNIKDNIYQLIENIGSGSAVDKIFIIGKGPSIDEIGDVAFPPGSLIININDSEKVIQGHIGIFSSNWVRHSLKDRGFKCKYYLAGKPLPSGIAHTVLAAIPFELDDEELSTYRLSRDEFYDETFVLSNALKVAVLVSKITEKKPDVYLLGFDFSTQKGDISKSLGKDYATESNLDRNLVVNSQENDYLQFMRYFNENGLLHLIHVGYKDYSTYTPKQFSEKISLKIHAKPVADHKPQQQDKVIIVAEFTNNHLGDPERIKEMVYRAKEAGADLVKVQKRDVDSFYSADKLASYYWSPFGKTLGEYRRGVELTDEKLQLLNDLCKEVELDWFCSVLDFTSLKNILQFQPNLIKIPSTISNHKNFHKQVADEFQGPIVISTGYTDKSYEDYILKTFAANKNIYLLHCISAYPTPMSDCNVSVVKHYTELAKLFPSVIPGYSSHDMGSTGSMLAVASGARMIEKHVKMGDVEWVHFDTVALDLKTDSFKNFVNDIRNAELILGSAEKKIMPSEHHKYEINAT